VVIEQVPWRDNESRDSNQSRKYHRVNRTMVVPQLECKFQHLCTNVFAVFRVNQCVNMI